MEMFNKIIDFERDKIFYQERLVVVEEDVKNQKKVYFYKVSILNDRNDILRKRFVDKFDRFFKVVVVFKDVDNFIVEILKLVIKEMEEMWF